MTNFTIENAIITIPLHVPKGYYLFWSWTTQADFKFHLTLADSSKVYFDAERQSRNPMPPLYNSAQTQGDNLSLTISVPQSASLDIRMEEMNITDSQGQLVARTVTLVGEDGGDRDYNDLWFSLGAWKSSG